MLLTGGSRPPSCARGYYLQPTVFINVPPSARIWKEEIFGPVLSGEQRGKGVRGCWLSGLLLTHATAAAADALTYACSEHLQHGG